MERYIIVRYGSWIAKPCGQSVQLFRMNDINWHNDDFMFKSLSQVKRLPFIKYPGFKIVKILVDKIEE